VGEVLAQAPGEIEKLRRRRQQKCLVLVAPRRTHEPGRGVVHALLGVGHHDEAQKRRRLEARVFGQIEVV
jgi:hypothetical protein